MNLDRLDFCVNMKEFLCLFLTREKHQNKFLRESILQWGIENPLLSTDMSKAFDCLHHPLLLAKLKTYGFESASLNLMRS